MEFQDKNGNIVYAYNQEERAEALRTSLTALAENLGFTPFRCGSHYSLKEMDSLMIYNDASWKRWSGKGVRTGGSQIDFLLEFGNVSSVPEAINYLLKFQGKQPEKRVLATNTDKLSANHPAKEEFILPERNNNYRRIYAYLIKTRKLSQEVVHDFIHRGLIYESKEHHNLVFCGMDPEGMVRYAGMRGTADLYGKAFKCDVKGNDKNYGVNIVNKESSELKVFESVIDCMSYIDLYGDNYSNKLVLSMVEDNPLQQFLSDYDHIRRIAFCLDNDEAGKKAIFSYDEIDPRDGKKIHNVGLLEKYENLGYDTAFEVPVVGKDFNETLVAISKEKENAKKKVDEKIRDLIDNEKIQDMIDEKVLSLFETTIEKVKDDDLLEGTKCVLFNICGPHGNFDVTEEICINSAETDNEKIQNMIDEKVLSLFETTIEKVEDDDLLEGTKCVLFNICGPHGNFDVTECIYIDNAVLDKKIKQQEANNVLSNVLSRRRGR